MSMKNASKNRNTNNISLQASQFGVILNFSSFSLPPFSIFFQSMSNIDITKNIIVTLLAVFWQNTHQQTISQM